MSLNEKAVIILCVILCLGAIAYALNNQINIYNFGNMKTIGLDAYHDSDCTLPLTEIDWGLIEIGQTYPYNAYLLNTGNSNATINMTTQNWNPQNASKFLTLTWDSQNKTLQPQKPLEVQFSLTVSNKTKDITTFSFDILLIATN